MRGTAGRYPELREFVAAVEGAYGDRLDGIYLFGSRARGEHRPDSDYDVAVVLNGIGDFWTEKLRLADLAYQQMLANDIHVQPHPFDRAEWRVDDPAGLAQSARTSAMELRA